VTVFFNIKKAFNGLMYNRCRPYSEMLTYKPFTNNAVSRKISVK
jgi:hypothetical protein